MNSTIIENTLISSQHLHVVSLTLDKLLEGKVDGLSGIQDIIIPEYQRPYVWQKKQVLGLLEDLYQFYQDTTAEKPLYYLGSFIFHQSDKGLNVIDGQQRLTSLLLLEQFTQRGITQVQYRNPLSLVQIKSNYQWLQGIFKGDDHTLDALKVLPELLDFSQINITLVVTQAEDLAYTFFETQNTGGIRLSGSDIVKAHHLRAIEYPKIIAYQAKRWETHQQHIETTIEYLTKLRYWDNRYWRIHPFLRDQVGKKNVIIDEFSLQTLKEKSDISYHYQIVERKKGTTYTAVQSPLKQVRQPLIDGNNALDYFNEYLLLYVDLFETQTHHEIDECFFNFYNKMIKSANGTVFLKDLYDCCILAYVSKFGYDRLYEVSMWLYRYIYSLRVTMDRNIREDSVFKFVKQQHLIDTILDVYTVDELLKKLIHFRYKFNTKYNEIGQSKDRHLGQLNQYFKRFKRIDKYKDDYEFDKDFIVGINEKLKDNDK